MVDIETGSDEHAIVVAEGSLSAEIAQTLYDRYYNGAVPQHGPDMEAALTDPTEDQVCLWQNWNDVTPSRGWWWMYEPGWKEPIVGFLARFADTPWQVATFTGVERIRPETLFLKCDVPPLPNSGKEPRP